MKYRILSAARYRVIFLAVSTCLLITSSVSAQTTYYPAKAPWNGFLAQTVIGECENNNSTTINATLTMTESSGQILVVHPFSIPPSGSRHIVLNALTDIIDRTGTYTIELDDGQAFLGDKLSCRTAFYRSAPAGSSKAFDYGYILPTANPQFGTLAGNYNSADPTGGNNLTSNWLSVLNLSDTDNFSGTVELRAMDGLVFDTIAVAGLGPNQRLDIPIGHPDGSNIGTYFVQPDDTTHPYDAVLIRYSPSPSGFNYAFAARGTSGNCSGEPLPASTMGNGNTDNYLEISNLSNQTIPVTVEIKDRFGTILETQNPELAYAQTHIYLSM